MLLPLLLLAEVMLLQPLFDEETKVNPAVAAPAHLDSLIFSILDANANLSKRDLL